MEYKSEIKQCQNCKKDFTIEPEDFNFYEKIKVPPPTFCPECRFQKRIMFRNEIVFYKRQCDLCRKSIITIFSPEKKYKVFCSKCWWGDDWDPGKYYLDYDPNKNFFEQFLELQKKTPFMEKVVDFPTLVNCEYVNHTGNAKNCYLIFNADFCENVFYSSTLDHVKDSADCLMMNKTELSYECIGGDGSGVYFSENCPESINVWYSKDCNGCHDCFGCVNLRHQRYCIFNQPFSKEEYQEKIKKINLETISGLKEAREKARGFWDTQPLKYHQGLKNLNSTGSFVTNCKNVNDSFLIRGSENMRYCQSLQVPTNKDCYDVSNWGENTELSYETLICGENSYNIKFCFNCWPTCRDDEYCMDLFSCSDCFGCVGLKKKQYCIFNKQYTKEEYFKMVEKIKKHMNEMPYVDSQGLVYKYGEFFPIEFSQLGYNNTVAIQYFPITKTEAEKMGYFWVETLQSEYKINKKSSELLDSIKEVSDEILKEIIECENCKKAYRIMENELIFLKKENLPLPSICHDCRYERRIRDRLTIKLYERFCMCGGVADETGIYKNTAKHLHGDGPCGEKFKTGHAPYKKEIVYCEKCYQQEVY